MQALKFVVNACRCHAQDIRHGVRIMRGELRQKMITRVQQHANARKVRDIGIDFAGINRITGQAEFLGHFNFGIPISALNQSRGNSALALRGQIGKPADHVRRATLVCLYSDTQPLPITGFRVFVHGFEYSQRKFQARCLLGIEGKRNVLPPCRDHQIDHAWHDFAHDPIELRKLQAR